jgi:hypothetical protein
MTTVYQIKTYTGATLDHTITSDAKVLRAKTSLTGQLGNFNFTLPGAVGFQKVFDDITLKDTVEIYIGKDVLPGLPLFKGIIENIDNVWGDDYMRQFSGRDLGEQMARQIFRQYSSAGDTAHNTVAKIAARLGMGAGEIGADATPITIVSNESKYDSYVREIGDYANLINKDWYIDVNNNIVWKPRPIRTSGVTTLTIGANVKSYTLTRSLTEVYNRIWVFGATEKYEKDDPRAVSACSCTQFTRVATDIPDDHDNWTETITDWTAGSGSGTHTGPTAPGSGQHCGAHPIANGVGAGSIDDEYVWLKRIFSLLRIKDEALLNFFVCQNCSGAGDLTKVEITLDAQDTSNYLTYTMDSIHFPGKMEQAHFSLKLGPGYEVLSGVKDGWVKTGDPDWYSLTAVKFVFQWNNVAGTTVVVNLDCLYFSNMRWSGYTEELLSQAMYGLREMVVTDDKLHSNVACANYAATVMTQKKYPADQLHVYVAPIDTNILIGDRMPVTIPNENLPGTNFDVISVEHMIPEDMTHAILLSNERARQVLKITDPRAAIRTLHIDVLDQTQRRKVVR